MLILLAVVLCSGCTAPYVSGEAIVSNKAVEAETNSILITNILRPLQFEVSTDDPTTSRFSVQYEGKRYYVHDRC